MSEASMLDALALDKLHRLALLLQELGIEHGQLTDKLGWRVDILGVDGRVFLTPRPKGTR